MEATKKRKINTRQLTAIKATKNNGKRVFYFRYYCPDLQKDNIRKFANTEAKARVLRDVPILTEVGNKLSFMPYLLSDLY